MTRADACPNCGCTEFAWLSVTAAPPPGGSFERIACLGCHQQYTFHRSPRLGLVYARDLIPVAPDA